MLLILADFPEESGVAFAYDFYLPLQIPALIHLRKDQCFPLLPVTLESGVSLLLILFSGAGIIAGQSLPQSFHA